MTFSLYLLSCVTNISYVLVSVKADVCDCSEKEIHKRGRNKEELSQYWMDRNQACVLTLDFPVSRQHGNSVFFIVVFGIVN